MTNIRHIGQELVALLRAIQAAQFAGLSPLTRPDIIGVMKPLTWPGLCMGAYNPVSTTAGERVSIKYLIGGLLIN